MNLFYITGLSIHQVSLLPLASCKLYTFGLNGEYVIQTMDFKLRMYHFSDDTYLVAWEKPIPPGIDNDCNIYIYHKYIGLRDQGFDENHPIHVFDKNLKELKIVAPTKGTLFEEMDDEKIFIEETKMVKNK